jgi:hypothetical protein
MISVDEQLKVFRSYGPRSTTDFADRHRWIVNPSRCSRSGLHSTNGYTLRACSVASVFNLCALCDWIDVFSVCSAPLWFRIQLRCVEARRGSPDKSGHSGTNRARERAAHILIRRGAPVASDLLQDSGLHELAEWNHEPTRDGPRDPEPRGVSP